MPNLDALSDFIALNIGYFEKGKWDYIGLASRYPELEVLAQLVPRKQMVTNKNATIVYQTETESTGHGAKAGDPIQPTQQSKALRRTVPLVKWVDSVSWTLDQNELLGMPDEHIVRQLQMDLVAFDLHWWQDLEEMMLQLPDSGDPDDDDVLFGFPAYITDDADIAVGAFEQYGGDDPYTTGRPGNITVAAQRKYTNPVAKFSTVTDTDFFNKLDTFLARRKLMGPVPNPRLLPDTPNDVIYCQLPVFNQVKVYLTGSNENMGMDTGRYRGMPSHKGVPFMLWHALDHPDSPVAPTTCQLYWIDWNSWKYTVQTGYDRKIEGPKDISALVPSSKIVTSEVWHQLTCDRPDRNLKMVSDASSLQP